jgi:hypothetical protein
VGNGGEAGVFQSVVSITGILVGVRHCRNPLGEFFTISFQDFSTVYGLDGPGIESRVGARFSVPVQTGPGGHPASCTMGTGSFLGLESGRGVTLIPHPLLVPRSKKQSRAIPLLSLRAFVSYKKGETYPTYIALDAMHKCV